MSQCKSVIKGISHTQQSHSLVDQTPRIVVWNNSITETGGEMIYCNYSEYEGLQ